MFRIKGFELLLGFFLILYSHALSAKSLSEVNILALPGTVALTFDDGPSPIYTPRVLDILKENNIKATFFVLGPLAKKFPEIIHRMVSEGHAVGVHSMTHPRLTRLNDSQLHYEVVVARDIVQKLIGIAPVCFRPPYELKNKQVQHFIDSHNLILVPDAFDSRDYTHINTENLIKRVIDNAQSERVFLFHDGYAHREKTVDALPKIIAGIRQKGLGFSTICMP